MRFIPAADSDTVGAVFTATMNICDEAKLPAVKLERRYHQFKTHAIETKLSSDTNRSCSWLRMLVGAKSVQEGF